MSILLANSAEIEQIIWARPMPAFGIVVAFGAALALTIYLYRRRCGEPKWVRIALAVARMAVLSLLLLILFEPNATVRETDTVKRRLPVLIDVSESMSIKDQRKRPEDIVEAATALGMIPLSDTAEDDGRMAAMQLETKQRQTIATSSRLDLAKSLLSKSARATLDSLGEDLDVSYYAFGKSLRMLSDGQKGGADSIAELKAADPGTSIADSLEAVASADRGAPIAGIVLLSDGLDTSLRQAEAASNGVPIFPVPMGIADPDDVSIRNVIIQEVAFPGDKVPVRVQIQSKGYEKRNASLSILLNGRTMETKTISFRGGLQFEDVFFNVNLQQQGAARVEVEIEPFTDEATAENNRVERSIRVVKERINVLCMEGSARWEYRYLRAMLKRDPRINATFVATRGEAALARNSSEYIARFPSNREEAFQYDLVILGDVDAAFFAPDELILLEELIRDRGGSLLMLCGSRFAPASYADTPVADMLPVRFDPGAEWEDVDESVYPVLTPEGRSSLVMTLEMDQETNDRVWTRVAPLDRIPPLLSPKPGATVLAELSDTSSRENSYPLVSWQRYGTGKCMAMATDRLWLLRFKTGDKYHWRVWSQCIQFLTLSRLMGEHKRIRLETDRSTYESGGQAQLYAHVLDDAYEPVSQSGFEILVRTLDGTDKQPQQVTLRPDTARPGLYEGYFSPPGPGRFRLEANSNDSELSNTTEFQVADINTEMANTDMQIERLQRIAELSGGQCLSIQQFGELKSLVNREPKTTTIRTDRPLWDDGWVAFLLVGFMGFEWIMRRKYDLK